MFITFYRKDFKKLHFKQRDEVSLQIIMTQLRNYRLTDHFNCEVLVFTQIYNEFKTVEKQFNLSPFNLHNGWLIVVINLLNKLKSL